MLYLFKPLSFALAKRNMPVSTVQDHDWWFFKSENVEDINTTSRIKLTIRRTNLGVGRSPMLTSLQNLSLEQQSLYMGRIIGPILVPVIPLSGY
jgi:hypothetical protein